jgi:hypothetical protein
MREAINMVNRLLCVFVCLQLHCSPSNRPSLRWSVMRHPSAASS